MNKEIIENLKEDEYIVCEHGLRPIWFKEKNSKIDIRGYFHKWVTYASYEGSEEYGLVEDYYGNMHEVFTKDVKFLDRY